MESEKKELKCQATFQTLVIYYLNIQFMRIQNYFLSALLLIPKKALPTRRVVKLRYCQLASTA